MNNACKVHYCFSYFVPRPITATSSHTGHIYISLPQILYIDACTLRDEYCLRPGLDVEVPSHLMLQSTEYDTKYIALLCIKAFTVDDEYCLTQLFHQVISSADKKQSGIF